MDFLLTQITNHALNYAIRSGISVTGNFAMKQCARLVEAAPRGHSREDLRHLQSRLENKIRIISPAIDMIELIAARGNTTLETAVQLTKDIRLDIQALGVRLARAALSHELVRQKSKQAKNRTQIEHQLTLITEDMRRLLTRIDDAVPLMNLAITTSGVNLTTNLPATVSPSRLLQASTLLTAADTKYDGSLIQRSQVGPTFFLSMYMLFAGHAMRPQDDENIRAETWKEVIHKARAKLVRVPQSHLYGLPGQSHNTNTSLVPQASADVPYEHAINDFSYQLLLIEDLDDGRVHTFDGPEKQPGPLEDVESAGIREVIPIHQISKIFYADTGKILNIGSDGETNSPVLLLKRDVNAVPPRRMFERHMSDETSMPSAAGRGDQSAEDDEQSEIDAQIHGESSVLESDEDTPPPGQDCRLPADLDSEWIAFEVYTEDDDSDTEGEDRSVDESPEAPVSPTTPRTNARDAALTESLSSMHLQPGPATALPSIKASLSLLEMLIRLTALQQFRQASHLTIEDELLNFFLADSSTTGAGPNAEYRQRVRRDARRRLGFDPYDESPLKRRSEDYIAHANASPAPSGNGEWQASTPAEHKPSRFSSPLGSPSFNGDEAMPSPSIFRS